MQGQAFRKDQEDAPERESHSDPFGYTQAIAVEGEVGKQRSEKRIGAGEDRGSAGQGKMCANVQDVDLPDKQRDEEEESEAFSGSKAQGNPTEEDPDEDGD